MLGLKILNSYNNYMKRLGAKGVYEDTPFPDLLTCFSESRLIENEYLNILKEYKAFLEIGLKKKTMVELNLYSGNDNTSPLLPWNEALEEVEREPEPLDWSSVILKLGKKDSKNNAVFFPHTMAMLNKLPNVVNAFFSSMGPESAISPHYGYLKGFLRYHLGLMVPEGNQSYLTVDGIPYYWQEGESVIFDDMYLHAAYNKSSQARVVLYLDFYRPLPFPHSLLNRSFINLIHNNRIIRHALKTG